MYQMTIISSVAVHYDLVMAWICHVNKGILTIGRSDIYYHIGKGWLFCEVDFLSELKEAVKRGDWYFSLQTLDEEGSLLKTQVLF